MLTESRPTNPRRPAVPGSTSTSIFLAIEPTDPVAWIVYDRGPANGGTSVAVNDARPALPETTPMPSPAWSLLLRSSLIARSTEASAAMKASSTSMARFTTDCLASSIVSVAVPNDMTTHSDIRHITVALPAIAGRVLGCGHRRDARLADDEVFMRSRSQFRMLAVA